MVTHVVEVQPGEDSGGVAGEGLSYWIDQHHLASPAADAGLGEAPKVIGKDSFEVDFSFEALLCGLDDGEGSIHLFLGGHQERAILQRPAVVLDVRDLQSVGGE